MLYQFEREVSSRDQHHSGSPDRIEDELSLNQNPPYRYRLIFSSLTSSLIQIFRDDAVHSNRIMNTNNQVPLIDDSYDFLPLRISFHFGNQLQHF